MGNGLLIGVILLLGCGALGLAIVFILAKWQDRKRAKFKAALESCPVQWSSQILDPKFNTRHFLKQSYRFGDLPVYMVPEGMLINDGGTLHWLERAKGSPLTAVASQSHPLDFIAMYKNYLWIQGGDGKFQMRGALAKGLDFKPLADDWGWQIYEGVPEGAE